ncbi:hypothetical protein SAMN05519103_03968 [Rhizobiales bacterium GAS113]|nr:hypothetical protein SAMN05519103_03968 [Rhizobiales bacterium GAS113]
MLAAAVVIPAEQLRIVAKGERDNTMLIVRTAKFNY